MDSTTIDTRHGKVKGIKSGTVSVFKGLRYAAAPVGPLRFRPPRAPSPWSGTFDATRFGPIAWQPRNPLYGTIRAHLSEDCLNLNIWTQGPGGDPRPVMVFLHGGGFRTGSGQMPVFDGTSFAKEGDVVLVTINYRLGPLGFLYLGDLLGPDYATSGNCGVLDQVAALHWVRDNIADFGGDPDRVTVFGESAGSRSIGALLCMPQARGLFQRAVLQSSQLVAHAGMRDVDAAADETSHLLDALDLAPYDLDRLRDVPAERLIEAEQSLASSRLSRWAPVLDGVAIERPLMDTLRSGACRGLQLMVGSNLKEFAFFMGVESEWRHAADDQARLGLLRERWLSADRGVECFYLDGRTGAEFTDGLIRLATYGLFAGPAQQVAASQLDHGPVWLYRFDWPSQRFGAAHATELGFVFHTTDRAGHLIAGDPVEIARLAAQMHRTWIAFARNGNPDNDAIPHWPPYDLQTRPTMLFDAQSGVAGDPYQEERQVWQLAQGCTSV